MGRSLARGSRDLSLDLPLRWHSQAGRLPHTHCRPAYVLMTKLDPELKGQGRLDTKEQCETNNHQGLPTACWVPHPKYPYFNQERDMWASPLPASALRISSPPHYFPPPTKYLLAQTLKWACGCQGEPPTLIYYYNPLPTQGPPSRAEVSWKDVP